MGDGTYERDNGWFVATGGVGLALTAGFAASRAIGNSQRRARAMQDAQARWRETDRGTIWVSNTGFYLHTAAALLPWTWEHVTSMSLAGPHLLIMTGQSTSGLIQWMVDSDWAELMFTLWCRDRYPAHPQFTGFTWIPGGWADRLKAEGLVPPPHPSLYRPPLGS